MIKAAFAAAGQDVSLAQSDLAGVHPGDLEDFIHDLLQPLDVIESLTYYLELTTTDERVCHHLHTIQAMLLKTHTILQRASLTDASDARNTPS